MDSKMLAVNMMLKIGFPGSIKTLKRIPVDVLMDVLAQHAQSVASRKRAKKQVPPCETKRQEAGASRIDKNKLDEGKSAEDERNAREVQAEAPPESEEKREELRAKKLRRKASRAKKRKKKQKLKAKKHARQLTAEKRRGKKKRAKAKIEKTKALKEKKKLQEQLEPKTKKQERKVKYHRLIKVQREKIKVLLDRGFSMREIARELEVSASTISRELARNTGQRGYREKQAQEMANERIKEKAAKRRKMTDALWAQIKSFLTLGLTPAMIDGRAKKDGREMVSRETIYNEYYRRQKLVAAEKSNEVLPKLSRKKKQRHSRNKDKKYSKNAGRGKIPGRVDIDQRPLRVLNRGRVGSWEGDLINGLNGTGHFVTLVERKTRKTLIAYVPSKESEVVMAAIIRLLKDLPRTMLTDLTFDNGKEFALFSRLETALGLKVYFAKPYHSWERGTNENRNRVVRKVKPKGSAFNSLTAWEWSRIEYLLNDRPMRVLNWRTPNEAFAACLERHKRPKRAA